MKFNRYCTNEFIKLILRASNQRNLSLWIDLTRENIIKFFLIKTNFVVFFAHEIIGRDLCYSCNITFLIIVLWKQFLTLIQKQAELSFSQVLWFHQPKQYLVLQVVYYLASSCGLNVLLWCRGRCLWSWNYWFFDDSKYSGVFSLGIQ